MTLRRVAPHLLLLCAGGAAAAGQAPKWACAIDDRPTGRHLFPLGKASMDTARATLEIADAKRVRVDALRLKMAAKSRNGTAQAAADNADAKELLGEAAHEVEEADRQLKNAKKEGLQEVTSVDRETLPQEVDASQTGVLVVFYAPWCPHCKRFVLQGPDGTPETAPIEVLNTQLQQAQGPKVVKFNTDAGQIPAGYNVQYVPTIIRVKYGQMDTFEGDHEQLDEVKKFALAEPKSPLDVRGIFGLHNASAGPGANATRRASLLQLGAARRLHPWAQIGDEVARLTGKSTRSDRHAALAALQVGDVPVGFPAPIDVHGKNLALSSVANTAEDVSPLGKLSEELDGNLQVNPMDALSSWVSGTRAVAGIEGWQARQRATAALLQEH